MSSESPASETQANALNKASADQPVTEAIATDPLAEARKLLEEGMLEQCVVKLKKYWLKHPEDPAAVRMFGELMIESGRTEVSRKLKQLAHLLEKKVTGKEVLGATLAAKNTTAGEAKNTTAGEAEGTTAGEAKNTMAQKAEGTSGKAEGEELDQDSTEENFSYVLFEAGFGLIDVRQHELALMLLRKCLEEAPDEPTVNYEIAFALMSLGRYEEAVKHFRCAAADNEDFDTILNLVVCYTLTRDLTEAKTMLEKLSPLAQTEEEQRELAHRKVVLKRLESFAKKGVLTPRDWLYVLYGSILLNTQLENTDKPDDHKSIASMLLVLKGFIEGMRLEYEAIEYYNIYARPLARILGELMDIPSTSYMGPDRPDRALLILAWASEIIGPHEVFIEHGESRSVFAYGLTLEEPLPVAPELCGRLTGISPMPWSEGSKTINEDKIVSQILDRARLLESDPDIVRCSQEAVEYYDSKRNLIVLNNWEAFKHRPEYTAEIVGTPRERA